MPSHALPPFSVFRARKGFFALFFMIMVIIVGSFAAQFYSWEASYRINPLTAHAIIAIPATTGGTAGTVICDERPNVTLHADKPGTVFISIDLTYEQKQTLGKAFRNLNIIIDIRSDGVFETVVLRIVIEGVVFSHHEKSVSILPGDYDVVFIAKYETNPVIEDILGFFEAKIWMIQA
jgi:hypothetical protein